MKCFNIPLNLPHIYIGPQLYMISPLPIRFVLLTVHCLTAVCTFVTCGSGRCDGLLAVLNGDWTDVDIHIVDVMWFVTCGSG